MMIPFISKLFQRQTTTRGEHKRRYKDLARKIATQGDLGEGDTAVLESTLAALNLTVEEFQEDTATLAEVARLEKMAARRDELTKTSKSAKATWKNLSDTLLDRFAKMRSEVSTAELAWRQAEALRASAAQAMDAIANLKAKHPRAFDAVVDDSHNYTLSHGYADSPRPERMLVVSSFDANTEEQLRTAGHTLCRAEGQSEDEFQSLLREARTFASGRAVYLTRRSAKRRPLLVPSGELLETLLARSEPLDPSIRFLPYPGTEDADFQKMMAELEAHETRLATIPTSELVGVGPAVGRW